MMDSVRRVSSVVACSVVLLGVVHPAYSQETNAQRLMDVMRARINSLCEGSKPGTEPAASTWGWFRASTATAPASTGPIDDWWTQEWGSLTDLSDAETTWSGATGTNAQDYWGAWCEEIKAFTAGEKPADQDLAAAWSWFQATYKDVPTVPDEVIHWTKPLPPRKPHWVWPWIWWWIWA